MNKKEFGFNTKAIHGSSQKNAFNALVNPIYQTSTFTFESAEQGGDRFALKEEGYIYSRLGNPTTNSVEEIVAGLENAEAAAATASGIGAITSAIYPLVQQGDHIVASNSLYGCTFAFLNHGLERFGIEVSFVDASDVENIKNAMKENTKIVYLETPANPHLRLSDIGAIAEIAHSQKDCVLVVDNTFATPYIQNPLDLGADVVVHSATKYLNGHADVVAGFVCGSADYIQQVKLFAIKDMTGSVLSPFDAFLVERGIKTLGLRMERHCENAMKIAEYLENHPKVETVYYPGLKSFPQYELAQRTMRANGGMISFELKGGFEDGKKLLNSLDMIVIAVSLGDTVTMAQHPASMTHSPYTKEEREEAGITDGLIRLTVGLENVEDIIADLDKALAKIN